jgi:hypothetical protein
MKGLTLGVAMLTLAACASVPLERPATVHTDWDRTLYYTRQNVETGNYFAADHVLDEFVRTHPGTRESREIAFWRAMYSLDPANSRGSLSAGIAALDGYLTADSSGWYRNQAVVLRRTAMAAQGVSALSQRVDTVAAPVATITDTVMVPNRSRDEEIAALRTQLARSKEELSKVSAELERIKKRLANPTQ